MTATTQPHQDNDRPSELVQTVAPQCSDEQNIDAITNDINQLQWDLTTILDFRAHAFGMKGQFTLAEQDAQDMINYAPTRAIGYLRLGELLSMQGKQSTAIQLYEEALKNVQEDDPAYPEFKQGKKQAIEKNKYMLDFTQLVPLKAMDVIFKCLPDTDKMTCLKVSTHWHDVIVNCASAWARIGEDENDYKEDSESEDDSDHDDSDYDDSDDDDSEGDNSGENDNEEENDAADSLLPAIPHVAKYVEYLEINTKSIPACQKYLDHLENGDFKNLKSLRLPDTSLARLTSTNNVMSFTNALWQIRNTLTTLNLTYNFKNINASIADILFYSPYLKTLVLNTSDYSLAFCLGDLEKLGGLHLALEDVVIATKSALGKTIKSLLDHCPNMRRLDLEGGELCVIDMIEQFDHENLQVLGFNSGVSVISLKELDKEEYDGPPGLRYILTPDGGNGVPAKSLIQLMHKHRKSLQLVQANMSLTKKQKENDEPFCDFKPTYEQWYFERLHSLTYWPDIYNVTEPMFLESIKSCKASLKSLVVVDSTKLRMVVDALIKLPPLELFHLSNVHKKDDDNDDLSDALIDYFKFIAALKPEEQKLAKVVFYQDNNLITAQVLGALGQVKSLRRVRFNGSDTISSSDTLMKFLSLVNDQVTWLELENMPCVNDDVLNALGNMAELQNLCLENNHTITDQGLIKFVNEAKALHKLTLEDCKRLRPETVSHIKSKVRFFIIK